MFDEWGKLPVNDENARLDNIAIYLQKDQPAWVVYLMFYDGKRACAGELKARAVRAKKWLMKRGIAEDRIIWKNAGYREEFTVQVWTWKRDVGEPGNYSTVSLNDVRVVNCHRLESFRYDCPRGDAVLPASCLEDMKVADLNRQLNSLQRHQLAYLFAKSYVVSIVRYQQDYYVNPQAPILQLMKANFPEFKDPIQEGGIWLQDLFNFFRSQSVYKRDVEESLLGLSAKQRKRFTQ